LVRGARRRKGGRRGRRRKRRGGRRGRRERRWGNSRWSSEKEEEGKGDVWRRGIRRGADNI
jgi:hypothetical protein